jgi:tetratricopeptide (TPR) repeat protein
MYNFNELKNLTEKSKKIIEKNEDASSDSFVLALSLLNKFNNNNSFNKEILQEATLKLIDSLKHKSNWIEPYLLLSYIFYIMDEIEIALKYFKIANEIDPESPLIASAREFLEKASYQSNKVQFEQSNYVKSTKDKPQIKKIRSISRLSISKGDT